MAENATKIFHSAFIKVEFIVDYNVTDDKYLDIYYRFPGKEFNIWKKVSDETEILDDLKQAFQSERLSKNDGNKDTVG